LVVVGESSRSKVWNNFPQLLQFEFIAIPRHKFGVDLLTVSVMDVISKILIFWGSNKAIPMSDIERIFFVLVIPL
jgi:hypothetical protein